MRGRGAEKRGIRPNQLGVVIVETMRLGGGGVQRPSQDSCQKLIFKKNIATIIDFNKY